MDIIPTFNNILQHEAVSTLIAFEVAVCGEGLKPKKIERLFNKLVDKNDYSKKDKESIIREVIKVAEQPKDN